MANTNAPFGFRCIGTIAGESPNFAGQNFKIQSSYATAIFQGDPVTLATTGYIGQAIQGTATISGIFDGCEYLSIANKRKVWSNYWPGSDAAGDVTCRIINHPDSLFQVQTDNTAIVQADIQANVNFSVATAGNTATGISGATIAQSTINTTLTLPFRIIDLVTAPPGGPGTEASAYNYALVTFNNVNLKSLTGI